MTLRWTSGLGRAVCAVGLALALSACGDDDYGIDGSSTPRDLSVNQDLTTAPVGDGGPVDLNRGDF